MPAAARSAARERGASILRSVTLGLFATSIGLYVAGCGGSVADQRVPSIGDPRAFAEEAAKLPAALGATSDKRVTLIREVTDGATRWADRVDGKDLTAQVPESIRRLDPREISATSDAVVVYLRMAQDFKQHGACVFLPSAPQERVDQVVQELKLRELDRDARVYEFQLISNSAILDTLAGSNP